MGEHKRPNGFSGLHLPEHVRAERERREQEEEAKPIGIREWFAQGDKLVTRAELYQVLDLLEKGRKKNSGWRAALRGKFDIFGLLGRRKHAVAFADVPTGAGRAGGTDSALRH